MRGNGEGSRRGWEASDCKVNGVRAGREEGWVRKVSDCSAVLRKCWQSGWGILQPPSQGADLSRYRALSNLRRGAARGVCSYIGRGDGFQNGSC